MNPYDTESVQRILRQTTEAQREILKASHPTFDDYCKIIIVIALGVALGIALFHLGSWAFKEFATRKEHIKLEW